MTDNTEALPPLPEKRWAGFCGKCHSTTQFQKRPNTKAAPCGRCGYATFCEELDYSDDEMRTYARAALAQRQQVPGGWQLVPKVPTQEMTEAGATSIDYNGGNARWPDIREAWADMLAAAPALTAAPSAQHNTIRGGQMAQGQPQGTTPSVTPGTEADRPTLSASNAQAESRVECDACPTVLGCVDKCMKAAPAQPTLCHRNPAPNASQPMVPTPGVEVTIAGAGTEIRMVECPGCGMEFADGALHNANLELHRLRKAAQAEPVAFTSQHQIEELRARKAGFAGRPDYLYAHAEPGGIYTVPLYAAPPAAQAEPQEPLTEFLTAQDKADLLRIEDCFSDGEGYDLPRERMARLAELGVIRHNGGGVYSITAFGMYCTGAWPVLPLKTAAESNDEAMRLHLERARGIGKQEGQ